VDEETLDRIQKIEKKIQDLEKNLLIQDSKDIETLKPTEHPVTGKEKPMDESEFNKKMIDLKE